MTETTAIAIPEAKAPLRAGGGIAAIVPQDAEQAYRMAALIVKSGVAPKDMNTPEKVVTAIFHGLEVGLKPMQAIQSIAVVNGRPCIWGDAALGLVMGSGALIDIAETFEGDGDALVAVCRAQRAGMASPIERRFGVADAKKAGLWGKGGPWTQYSRRMLQMRARSWALRDGFADVLKGLGVAEEVRDFVVAESHARDVETRASIRAELTAPPPRQADHVQAATIDRAVTESLAEEAAADADIDPDTGEVRDAFGLRPLNETTGGEAVHVPAADSPATGGAPGQIADGLPQTKDDWTRWVADAKAVIETADSATALEQEMRQWTVSGVWSALKHRSPKTLDAVWEAYQKALDDLRARSFGEGGR